MNQLMIKLFLFLMVFSSISQATGGSEFSRVDIQINNQTLPLEYADTEVLRNQGLMYRKQLCIDCGMLFKLDQAHQVEMWMKNTYIPLDVAFIRADGLIVGIEAMQPLDQTLVKASEKVLYVWEMNQDWFQANDIAVGDKVFIY
ncbi:MAG: hypothetical protein ISEC1_P0279 [Thiomicrorhabdus sp.]|nr:MAG: hypothetical protein ISEC1_P0279 [Thiomicrorhabdus sp.]